MKFRNSRSEVASFIQEPLQNVPLRGCGALDVEIWGQSCIGPLALGANVLWRRPYVGTDLEYFKAQGSTISRPEACPCKTPTATHPKRTRPGAFLMDLGKIPESVL